VFGLRFDHRKPSSVSELIRVWDKGYVAVESEYFWKFGDGRWAYGQVVSHIYRTRGTFIVTLTVTPITGEPVAVRKGLVTVSEYSTVYNWDWNGDAENDGSVVEYVWNTKGSKIVTLTCVSADATVSRKCLITVTGYAAAEYSWSFGSYLASAQYSWNEFGTKIVSLTVTGHQEVPSIRYVQIQVDDVAVEATWHYGDGVSDALGVHEYSEAGVFDVTLDVDDNKGDSDSLTEENYITVTEA
jgi:PKD repeat protein